MFSIEPDEYYVSVLDIDPQHLKSKGYKVVLIDLDNTLQPYGDDEVPQAYVDWVGSVRKLGMGVVLMTNTAKHRAIDAANELGVPLIRNAMKPFSKSYIRACAIYGAACKDAVMIGDQCYTDILGANKVGMDSIMVVPQSGADPLHTYLLRFMDHRAVRKMRATGSAT